MTLRKKSLHFTTLHTSICLIYVYYDLLWCKRILPVQTFLRGITTIIIMCIYVPSPYHIQSLSFLPDLTQYLKKNCFSNFCFCFQNNIVFFSISILLICWRRISVFCASKNSQCVVSEQVFDIKHIIIKMAIYIHRYFRHWQKKFFLTFLEVSKKE